MKTRKKITITLCIILLFSFVPNIITEITLTQPLDLYGEEKMK